MKLLRYRLTISGNVHRIGFRHQSIEYARSLGLSGWAGYDSNLIFIEAEGSEDPLNLFVEWCKKGPEGCTVQSFEITEMEPLNSKEFVICLTRLGVCQELPSMNIFSSRQQEDWGIGKLSVAL